MILRTGYLKFISNLKTLVHDHFTTDALRQVALSSYAVFLNRKFETQSLNFSTIRRYTIRASIVLTIKEKDSAIFKYFSNDLYGAIFTFIYYGQGQKLKSSSKMKFMLTKFPPSLCGECTLRVPVQRFYSHPGAGQLATKDFKGLRLRLNHLS